MLRSGQSGRCPSGAACPPASGPIPQISLRSSGLPPRAAAGSTAGLCSSETAGPAEARRRRRRRRPPLGSRRIGRAGTRRGSRGPADGTLLRSASPAALTAGARAAWRSRIVWAGPGGAAAFAGGLSAGFVAGAGACGRCGRGSGGCGRSGRGGGVAAAASGAASLAASSSKRLRQEPTTEPS